MKRVAITLGALVLACGPAAAPPAVAPVAEPSPEPAPPDWLVAVEPPPLPLDGSGGGLPAEPEPVFQSITRNNVIAVDFTRDGRALVALGGDGEASVIDLSSGRIRAAHRIFVRRAIRSLEVSARGVAYVVNGSSFGTSGGVRSWDLRSGRVREVELPGVAFVDAQAFALDERSERIALVHEEEGEVRLRLQGPGDDPRDLAVERTFPAFTPAGTLLLRHAEGGWALRAFDGEEDLHGEEAGATVVEVHPEGRAIFASGEGLPLTWRDPLTGERLGEVALAHPAPMEALAVSGDGERVLVLWRDGTLQVLSVRDGTSLGKAKLPNPEEAATSRALWYGHAGERLYYLQDQALVVVPLVLAGEEELQPVRVPISDYVVGMAISEDGRWLASYGRSLHLFDLRGDIAEATPRRFEPSGGAHSVWGAAWASDETALVTYGRGGVEVWGADGLRTTGCHGSGEIVWGESPVLFSGARRCDLATGETAEAPGALGLSADRRRVLVDQGRHLAIVDAAGQTLGRARKAPGAPTCPAPQGQCQNRHALSADGEVLAVATEKEVLVHDRRGRRRGRLRLREQDAPIAGVKLSPDGASLLLFQSAGGEGLALSLYRVRGMTRVAELGVSTDTHYAFSPDAELLAVALGSEVALIDVTSGRALATHDAEATVQSVEIGPDGSAVAVTTREGFRVLDRDGAPRATRRLAQPWVLSPDAEKLAHCEAGNLLLTDLLTQETRGLGACARGDRLSFSPRGSFVTAIRGAYVEVHRVSDGETLALHAPRVDANLDRETHAYAVDEAGAYELAGTAAPERFLYRRAGSLLEAELVPLADAPASPGLVAGFFGAPVAEGGAD